MSASCQSSLFNLIIMNKIIKIKRETILIKTKLLKH